jgi:hypothetical protein
MIEKTVKDGRKLRKMSNRAQMWTGLQQRMRNVSSADIIRQVSDGVKAQLQITRSFSRIVFGISQWQSPRKK